MYTPDQITKLVAFRDAGAEVTRVLDESDPWSFGSAGVVEQLDLTIEEQTGRCTVEILPEYRARFDESVRFIDGMYSEEPREDAKRSAEEKSALATLLQTVQAASATDPITITVDSVAIQRTMAEVLADCLSDELRKVSHEGKLNAHARWGEFNTQVDRVDHWFALLKRVEPA